MNAILRYAVLGAGCLMLSACHHAPHEAQLGPPYDRPFPLGQVSDSHWETMQTNAEAMDFIFYDHEFVGSTEKLTALGKKHLLQVALRLEHVPFPVVIEESPDGRNPQLDQKRRMSVLNELEELGLQGIEQRVVVAPVLTEGLSAIEGEAAYYQTIRGGFGGGAGRRFGGSGGFFR